MPTVFIILRQRAGKFEWNVGISRSSNIIRRFVGVKMSLGPDAIIIYTLQFTEQVCWIKRCVIINYGQPASAPLLGRNIIPKYRSVEGISHAKFLVARCRRPIKIINVIHSLQSGVHCYAPIALTRKRSLAYEMSSV